MTFEALAGNQTPKGTALGASNKLLSKGPYSLLFYLCIILNTSVSTVPMGTEQEEQVWLVGARIKHHFMSTLCKSTEWWLQCSLEKRRTTFISLPDGLESRTLRKEPHLLQTNVLEGKLYNSPSLLFVQITSNSEHCRTRKWTTISQLRHFPFTLLLFYSPKHSFFYPDLERLNQGCSYRALASLRHLETASKRREYINS